ncbi:predicted protein [Chaetomium globosum CBS 148.51]|uniref:Uncharacterized protein n=1 Tax=Chaetomium globosum (strain ATCC 6205 / CBS 148.51 / DSM 1962 / NBRC 6347 / NRRL 1970) TaxID=306901 RepID=Q2H9V1_CHAGB|nr:uncharacterized protein CHGG_03003 [Chaetomium globosum CBS 148.51]EAQ91068.1 predicted protein [Chaetomium globosum CBS 148.51]
MPPPSSDDLHPPSHQSSGEKPLRSAIDVVEASSRRRPQPASCYLTVHKVQHLAKYGLSYAEENDPHMKKVK